MDDFLDQVRSGKAGPDAMIITALAEDPSPYSAYQTTYDTPGHHLAQQYVDHASAVHRSLLENGGITVDPSPGSEPEPVGDPEHPWYGVGQAPDYSRAGAPPTPSQEPVPVGQYSVYHALRHVLRTESNRNLSRQFADAPTPYVGGWRTSEFKGREGEDLVVEDQSTVHATKTKAMQQARQRNEQAVFEAHTFSEIKNPHYRQQ